MTEAILIPRKITLQLLHWAQQTPDHEICGLLGGQNGLPTSCYPVENAAANPSRHFLLNAAEQVAAMKTMRERDEVLFAIYHSHPHAPATPSPADLKQAVYREALYLIISLNTQGLLEMRGFKISPRSYEEIPLLLAEHSSRR